MKRTKEPQFDYSKLRGKLVERGITTTKLGEILGISRISMSSRLNGTVPFKDTEIVEISKYLGIPAEQIPKYFFTEKVK